MNFFLLLIFLAFSSIAFAKKNATQDAKFTDPRDKKQYKTVNLGGRVWMAEDLNYNKTKVYDFEALQKACPDGWRLPSKSAWEDLKKEIGSGSQGKWWAATSGIDTTIYYVAINLGFGGINQINDVKSAKYAVRCIQNMKAKPSEKKNDIKLYKTVQVGNQLWMAENLNFKTGKSWCFENDDYNCNLHGRLYDWNTAAKACPSGWHLPTRREWNLAAMSNFSVTLSESKAWWGLTEHGNANAYSWHIQENNNEPHEKISDKSIGYSVRCAQNIKAKPSEKKNNIKLYQTAKIGNQTWMTENLNFKTGKSWCFEDDDFYCQKYGRLYDWNTALKACPRGWHLPSDAEWNELEKVAGKNLVSAISILQGGWRDSDSGEKTGLWRELDENGFLWTSTTIEAIGSVQARQLSPLKDFSTALRNKSGGLSVRCVQNPPIKKVSRLFIDSRDSKKYGVMKAGNTLWMRDNLNYNAKGSFCYDNKAENCERYGRLYEWDLAQTVCPSPWRLASDEDWVNLAEKFGNNAAGKKLKSKQQWNGTDNYGFAALPGGFTKAQGFAEIGERGYWWTSDAVGPSGKQKFMASDRDSVTHSLHSKSTGLSVRCVQDCGLFNCVME